ncbi:protein NLP9-like [Bidens hawaiensis]|uniref:protein NLP9-like n=1 Tax=Bidens hawaiensis TaxID=980011 RepID=UPI00404A05A8
MILSGGPAPAFLSHMPYIDDLVESSLEPSQSISIMLPVSSPFGSSCIGVVECTISEYGPYDFCSSLFDMNKALKDAGLDVFNVQSHIPYKTVDGLKPARDEIAKALEIVCGSHNITLAQVWIAYEDEYNVPLVSSLDDPRKRRMLALKLTGYLSTTNSRHGSNLEQFYNLCDIVPQETEELALKTLQNYEPRYISTFGPHRLMYERPWDMGSDYCANSGLAVCLRSIETGDFNYAFEFIWRKHSNTTIMMMLEGLLLTLKRCLPSFRFASGGELGDELDVIDVKSSTKNETSYFKIFQGIENGKKHSEVRCKTGSILLPREVIETQFGRTIKDATKNLNVSESTLKRKFKDLGILEWPGPKLANRKANDSSIIQIDTIGKDNEEFQGQAMMIIKAHGADDIIKFYIPISQATFENVDNKVRTKFKLTLMTYKIKYRDEFGDWILLTSDEDMSCCMESMRRMNRAIVDLHVMPSTQPISGSSGSYSTK